MKAKDPPYLPSSSSSSSSFPSQTVVVPILLPLLLYIAVHVPISAYAAKLGEDCSNQTCDEGLECGKCAAADRPRCTSVRPMDPRSKVQGKKGLPFNMYSWLTTHNSFANVGKSLLSIVNQEDSIASQLHDGVRGLMLDIYDFEDDIWLCHSIGSECNNSTAFQRATDALEEVQTFLEANPAEIITIFLEDYVKSPTGLSKLFDAAGLRKYWFPVTNMPKNGEDWPLVGDMIDRNHRLIVFTSKRTKEASEGIAYQWNYVVENQYGEGGMIPGLCESREESAPMNDKTRSLVLMNHFPNIPTTSSACRDNSAALLEMLYTCHSLSGKRWPNYIAVDFYKISDAGGATMATDVANGRNICGCDNINHCRANAPFGTCVVPQAPTPSSTPQSSKDGGVESPSSKKFNRWLMIQSVLVVMVLLK